MADGPTVGLSWLLSSARLRSVLSEKHLLIVYKNGIYLLSVLPTAPTTQRPFPSLSGITHYRHTMHGTQPPHPTQTRPETSPAGISLFVKTRRPLPLLRTPPIPLIPLNLRYHTNAATSDH